MSVGAVVEHQIESWQLGSGRWEHDRQSEDWRLAVTGNGQVVSRKLPSQDVGRLMGARREPDSGQWLPPEFNYSPRSGAPLASVMHPDSAWVPPYGAAPLANISKPLARGLRQTAASLKLARSHRPLTPTADADRALPPLPAGQYRFIAHRFDVASCVLMAIEPAAGRILVLLPETNTWVQVQPSGENLVAGVFDNYRGWRMEVVESVGSATLCLPNAAGLALVTPSLIGLSYSGEYCGEGPAVGGPVAWADAVWLPVVGHDGVVSLVGKGVAPEPVVLRTTAVVPPKGFEAPVFDLLQVIWPSDEGQLVLRMGQKREKECDWIGWPDGLEPVFSLGCPYLSLTAFWQLCRSRQGESLAYVQMGTPSPEQAPVSAPRYCTGRFTYENDRRSDGDPWSQPDGGIEEKSVDSSQTFLPLMESEHERAVIGLRINAQLGIRALLNSDAERQRAVLELQIENRPGIQFGTLMVSRPWLTSFFVHDGHLWVYHPELPQPLGWKLES